MNVTPTARARILRAAKRGTGLRLTAIDIQRLAVALRDPRFAEYEALKAKHQQESPR